MGTSSDFTGGSGGAWTGYKRAATSFAKTGGGERAGRVLARLVATLGGAAAAAASSTAGARTTQALGGFLGGVADGGLAEGLTRTGLGDLVGSTRYEVLNALVDALAGAGDDVEAVAARSALVDTLDELFPDGDDFEDLDALQLDGDGVRDAFTAFLAHYIYNRAAPVLEERLNHLEPQLAEARDAEIHDYVRSLVALNLQGTDPLATDWSGQDGQRVAQTILRQLYEYIEALDQ